MRARFRLAGPWSAGLAALALSCGSPAPESTRSSAQTAPARTDGRFGTVEAPVFASTLDASTARDWAAHVWPTAEELAFEEIPWVPTFRDGVLEADARDKPVLLWVMNGHPLGCT